MKFGFVFHRDFWFLLRWRTHQGVLWSFPWRLDSQQVFSTGLSHSVAQVLSFRQKLLERRHLGGTRSVWDLLPQVRSKEAFWSRTKINAQDFSVLISDGEWNIASSKDGQVGNSIFQIEMAQENEMLQILGPSFRVWRYGSFQVFPHLVQEKPAIISAPLVEKHLGTSREKKYLNGATTWKGSMASHSYWVIMAPGAKSPPILGVAPAPSILSQQCLKPPRNAWGFYP